MPFFEISKKFKENEYQKIKKNVDTLNIIQIGLTFTNERGEMPPDDCAWQFNFKFDIR
jgi:CCR4-NOT transcription complex subunit 7/8